MPNTRRACPTTHRSENHSPQETRSYRTYLQCWRRTLARRPSTNGSAPAAAAWCSAASRTAARSAAARAHKNTVVSSAPTPRDGVAQAVVCSVRTPEAGLLRWGVLGVKASLLSLTQCDEGALAAELLSTLKGSEPAGEKVERYGCVRRLATTPVNCGTRGAVSAVSEARTPSDGRKRRGRETRPAFPSKKILGRGRRMGRGAHVFLVETLVHLVRVRRHADHGGLCMVSAGRRHARAALLLKTTGHGGCESAEGAIRL
jgi:hypothetical protein